MCGIAGILNRAESRVSASLLRTMARSMLHRGPDDQGIAMPAENLGFAFRRLAILDLSPLGHQPMVSQDGNFCIIFNGEIYNAPELREEYAPDYPYRSRTDTEVILALLERMGLQTIPKLNGMFSIAIWDRRTRRLHLVTDRLGIKPLYYAITDEGMIFGSEIKALFAHPAMAHAIDIEGVNEYFTFQFTLGERTLYRGVSSLEPATILSFDVDQVFTRPMRQRYWEMKFQPDTTLSIEEHAVLLREAIQRAIVRQTRSDVKVGSFLSSGMDTGAITALARQAISGLETFTCGFAVTEIAGQERFTDERGDARELARELGTQHHEIAIGATAVQTLFDQVMFHLEDPKVGISYQILAMAEEVKRNVTVVLSGTGGDELFGGYTWRYGQILEDQDPQSFALKYYEIWSRILPDVERKKYFHPERVAALDLSGPRAGFDALLTGTEHLDPLSRALAFDAKTFLRGLLTVDDKLNMAHSVESRVPLLDHEVLDVALRIPSKMKFAGQEGKLVLKHALRGILPDAVISRRKQGFTPPDASWFRHENRDWVQGRLLSESFLDRRWFSRDAVVEILADHFSGRRNSRFLIWSMLCLDGAYSQLIDGKMCVSQENSL